MRSFGSGAIWSMVVPYCMIHYGKPYLEASSAIIAGVVLGSLAMRTRSIYAGFLVHATVAVLMDVLALERRNGLPIRLTPGSRTLVEFTHWTAVIWIAWAIALAVLAVKVRRSMPEIRAAFRRRPSATPPLALSPLRGREDHERRSRRAADTERSLRAETSCQPGSAVRSVESLFPVPSPRLAGRGLG